MQAHLGLLSPHRKVLEPLLELGRALSRQEAQAARKLSQVHGVLYHVVLERRNGEAGVQHLQEERVLRGIG